MARVFGQIGEFNPESEKVSTYLERVQLYIDANGVEDDKKVAVLLTVVGSKCYGLLESLLAPAKPKDKTYDELVTALKGHYEPKPLVIAERFQFYKRCQQSGETIADFVADLRKLAVHCDFGTFLDQALRDRLVCGLKNEQTQKKLLAEADLTYAKALQIAQGAETAENRAREMKEVANASVFKLKVRSQCYHCGKHHDGISCRFKSEKCFRCGKVGHIASVCRAAVRSSRPSAQQESRVRRPQQQTTEATRNSRQSLPPRNGRFGREESAYWVESDSGLQEQLEDDGSEELLVGEVGALSMFKVGTKSAGSIAVQVKVNGKQLEMELDTGAAVSIITEEIVNKEFPGATVHPSTIVLKTYTGEVLNVVGELPVKVQYRDQGPLSLSLVVVKGTGPCLFGRNWLRVIKLDWQYINAVTMEEGSGRNLNSLLNKYSAVFREELGTITPYKVQLHVRESAKPKFCRARQVPFSLKSAVNEELERMESEGVLKKVDVSEWATPLVIVPKKNNKVRLCGDYRITINAVMDIDQYPLPRAEDIFATLAGGKCFSKLDLTNAYQQMLLEDESCKFVTINTSKGLYQYTRLPFGVASAPAIFQKTMDRILQGIEGVECYIDDVLIATKTKNEHMKLLDTVLQRLQQHGVRIRKEKCKFLSESVEFLGYRIDAEGRHPLKAKVEAIQNAPIPKNVSEVRSFLGLLNYYGAYIPNLSSLLYPLNQLLCKKNEWAWSSECDLAFQKAKQELVSADVLVHYDSTLPVVLAGDASAYGVGAVISHIMPDGRERPIAFASRTLSSSERNYSQIEKEALSLVFGIKKFHNYLYGRKFILETDHKPLTAILGSKKGIPVMAAARLQRWAVQLLAYNYDIRFRSTLQHANADGLSRLPLQQACTVGHYEDPSIFNLSQIDCLPVTAKNVRFYTSRDRELSQVLQFVMRGWPQDVDASLLPYYRRRNEMSVEEGCMFWGMRAVIPYKLQQRVLQELHNGHPGIARMKALARSYMWWPGLDTAIEDVAKSCVPCQSVKHAPPLAPLQPWTWPAKPFERVHVDFAGPIQGTMLLVLVDAHSKWPEVFPMAATTTGMTIEVLRKVFASHGLPKQLVSDNGPQFTSKEFEVFMKKNGVHHIRVAPYHPASNGLAERFVQSVKMALKTSERDGRSLNHRLCEFLLTYRNTPHATTGVSPASLLVHRPLCTRLDLLKPDRQSHVVYQQARQKKLHDDRSQDREFFVGQKVMVRNLRPGCDWVPGVIIERSGPVSYVVHTSDQQIWKRHIDQLKELRDSPIQHSTEFDGDNDWNVAGTHAEVVCSDTTEAPPGNPVLPTADNVEPSVTTPGSQQEENIPTERTLDEPASTTVKKRQRRIVIPYKTYPLRSRKVLEECPQSTN